MQVEIEVSGATELTARLEQIGERLDQPAGPLLQVIADSWQTDFQANFERQGTVEGGPWEELAPMTQSIRRSRGFQADRPILQRTGDLFHSIQLREMTDSEVAVGTDLRYAAILQEGGVETYFRDVPGERDIPPRPFIVLHAELIEDVETQVQEYFFPSAAGDAGGAGA